MALILVFEPNNNNVGFPVRSFRWDDHAADRGLREGIVMQMQATSKSASPSINQLPNHPPEFGFGYTVRSPGATLDSFAIEDHDLASASFYEFLALENVQRLR